MKTLYDILVFYLKHGDFTSIKNCGKKSNMELSYLAHKFTEDYGLTLENLKLSKDERAFEDFKLYCYKNFNVPSEESEPHKKAFLQKDFPFFKYLMMSFTYILDEREYFIFKQNFGYLRGKSKLTLQAIGDKYNITRERVRQISQKVPLKLEKILSLYNTDLDFIKDYFNYQLKVKRDFILIDGETADHINEKEELALTQKFYALAFGVLHRDKYHLFQNRLKDYENYYLVKKELAKRFDFRALYDTIEEKLDSRIEADYKLPIDTLIEDFIHPDASEKYYNKVKSVTKRIVTEGFGIKLDRENNLLIKRNTIKKLSEYILEILRDYKRPMHLEEICEELKKRATKIPPNIESLRSSILSIEEIMAIGKTSTYSLKEWGEVKTGTIKNMVREYLEQTDEPKHIAEVSRYVRKYRKTNDKNIMSNLKLDKSDTFRFYKKGYVGLRSKDYSNLKGELANLKPLG
ncbi:MAG: hypothetical protein K9I94_05040 [Bacteroidales bacterium]|nr:hypothetical protein [Bacteroidales bacterium]